MTTRGDTPRTDAMIYAHIDDPVTGEGDLPVVHADDCRALEREIQHWRAMYARASDILRAVREADTDSALHAIDDRGRK